MATWADLAKDNRLAAYELKEAHRWRACVSRAYYAIFSEATGALIGQGVAMPKAQNNPSHARLPTLVGHHLRRVKHALRWRLAGVVGKLYKLRLAADYQPQVAMAEAEARQAIGLMEQAFRCMEGEA